MKGTNLEEVRVRGRKRGKEVRGDERGQPFTCRKKKTRCLYWARQVSQLDHPCPCLSIAPCLHCKLHVLSLSLCLCLVLEGDNKVYVFGNLSAKKKNTLGFAPKSLPCSVLIVCLFLGLGFLLNPIGTKSQQAMTLGGLNPSFLIFPCLGSELGFFFFGKRELN